LGYLDLILGLVSLKQIKITGEKGKNYTIGAILIGIIWGPLKSLLHILIDLGY